MLLPRETAQFGGKACVTQLKSLSRATFCVALFFLFFFKSDFKSCPVCEAIKR